MLQQRREQMAFEMIHPEHRDQPARGHSRTRPTSNAPTKPGPRVTATPPIAELASRALQRLFNQGDGATWSREASSGTTPP